MNEAKFSDLLGKTIVEVESDSDDSILFRTDNGEVYRQYHHQDCCESVYVEDVCGDFEDLIGSPILLAEEVESSENPPDVKPETIEYQDSFTWTFYKLATIKGSVTIRWYGSSNGYYSESVDFERVK